MVTLAVTTAACSSGPAPSAQRGPTITMADLAFSPTTLTVSPGQTVTVVNNDQVTHNVTATGGQFRSGNVAPTSSATFKAPTRPGRYPYTCTIHPFMRATLVVR